MIIQKLIRWYKNYKIKTVRKSIKLISKNSIINFPLIVDHPSNLEIQDYVYIGPNAWISCYTDVIIKRGTIIGPRLKIYTGNHNYDNENSLSYDHITFAKSVLIEENV